MKNTKLLPGLHVSKGQVVAVIQYQQYIQMQQDYLTAKARLSYLQKEHERQKELNVSKSKSNFNIQKQNTQRNRI